MYRSLLASFDTDLHVTLETPSGFDGQPVAPNKRLPSAQQVHGVLKRELVEKKFAGQAV